MIFAAVLGTRSRGAWLGLAVGLIVARFVWRKGRAGVSPAATGNSPEAAHVSLCVFPAALFALLPDVTQQARALWTHLEGRLYLVRASWPMFTEHPLLGGGWGMFQLRFLDLQAQFTSAHPEYARYWTHLRQLHDDPLQILLEAGAVGFVAFGWLLWTYGREVRSVASGSPRPTQLWLGASAGGATAILVDSLFNFQFAVPPTFILLFTFLSFPACLRPARANSEIPLDADTRAGGRPLARALASIVVLGLAALLIYQIARRAHAELAHGRGLAEERQGDWVSAEQSYRDGLTRFPNEGRLRYGLARALYLQGRYPEALAESLRAERTVADSHLAVLQARIADQLGFRSPALQLYRHALWLNPTLKSVGADITRLQE
jgi:hypothetical protein